MKVWMSMGLAQRLREGTRALHTATERAGLMPAMLRGTLPAGNFLRLQQQMLLLYTALESALQQHADHPALAPLPLAALRRCTALQADLPVLQRAAGSAASAATATATATATASMAAYTERLQGLARTDPARLAAHAYVRYLGDLSGGQALRRLAQRSYGLPGDEGTRFYDFGPPAQVAALAQRFRQALDALPLDEAGIEAQVAEARWAFAQHERLFIELAPPGMQPPAASDAAIGAAAAGPA